MYRTTEKHVLRQILRIGVVYHMKVYKYYPAFPLTRTLDTDRSLQKESTINERGFLGFLRSFFNLDNHLVSVRRGFKKSNYIEWNPRQRNLLAMATKHSQ